MVEREVIRRRFVGQEKANYKVPERFCKTSYFFLFGESLGESHVGCSRILQFDELAEEIAELSTAPLGVDRLLSRAPLCRQVVGASRASFCPVHRS